jgi:hypothetical protein
LKLANVTQDFVELAAEELGFLGLKFELRKFSYPQHFFSRDSHGHLS